MKDIKANFLLYMGLIVMSAWLVGCGDNSFSNTDSSVAATDTDKVKLAEVTDDTEGDRTAEEEDRIERAIDSNGCGNHNDVDRKVRVCHFPSGNTENSHTLCLPLAALKAHVGIHGDDVDSDYIGDCDHDKPGKGGNCNGDDDSDDEGTDEGDVEGNT